MVNILNSIQKGKENFYDTIKNRLLYEGEFSGWKKNGKGKEYDIFNKIIFEGEYSNGKRVLKRFKILKNLMLDIYINMINLKD